MSHSIKITLLLSHIHVIIIITQLYVLLSPYFPLISLLFCWFKITYLYTHILCAHIMIHTQIYTYTYQKGHNYDPLPH